MWAKTALHSVPMQHQLHPRLFRALSPYFQAGAPHGSCAPGGSPSTEPGRKVQKQPRPPERPGRGHLEGKKAQGLQPGLPANSDLEALVLPLSSPWLEAQGEPGHAPAAGPSAGSAEDEGEGGFLAPQSLPLSSPPWAAAPTASPTVSPTSRPPLRQARPASGLRAVSLAGGRQQQPPPPPAPFSASFRAPPASLHPREWPEEASSPWASSPLPATTNGPPPRDAAPAPWRWRTEQSWPEGRAREPRKASWTRSAALVRRCAVWVCHVGATAVPGVPLARAECVTPSSPRPQPVQGHFRLPIFRQKL